MFKLLFNRNKTKTRRKKENKNPKYKKGEALDSNDIAGYKTNKKKKQPQQQQQIPPSKLVDSIEALNKLERTSFSLKPLKKSSVKKPKMKKLPRKKAVKNRGTVERPKNQKFCR